MKKVSIIVTNYNKALYIKDCLISILKHETYTQVEVIIIDDCSNDGSDKIITDWLKANKMRTKNWFFYSTTTNSGPAASINLGLKYASGEIISFFDGDDILMREFIQDHIDKISPSTPVLYSDGITLRHGLYSNYGFNNKLFQMIKNCDNASMYRYLVQNIPSLSISCALLDRNFLDSLGGFDPNYFSNDWLLNIKIFKALSHSDIQILLNEEPVFIYRISEANTISNLKKLQIIYTDIIKSDYIPLEYKSTLKRNIYMNLGINALLKDQYRSANFFYIQSMATYDNIDYLKTQLWWLFIFLYLVPVPKRFLVLIKTIFLGKKHY